jgi:hypothetical protein
MTPRHPPRALGGLTTPTRRRPHGDPDRSVRPRPPASVLTTRSVAREVTISRRSTFRGEFDANALPLHQQTSSLALQTAGLSESQRTGRPVRVLAAGQGVGPSSRRSRPAPSGGTSPPSQDGGGPCRSIVGNGPSGGASVSRPFGLGAGRCDLGPCGPDRDLTSL